MDQIALHKHGFQNTVASMGTAISAWQVERLSSMTKNIYLALDSDAAGLAAMERANKMFAEKGVTPKYINFTPQKDPDDFLKANGAMAFQEKLDNAPVAFDVLLAQIIPDKLPEVLDRKLEIMNKAFEIISPLHEDLSATERVVTFAKRIGLKNDPTQIVKGYTDFLKKHQNKTKIHPLKKEIPSVIPQDDLLSEIQEEVILDPAFHLDSPPEIYLTKIEKLLVQEIVQLPALLNMDKMNEILDLVTNDEVKKYVGKIRKITMEVDDSEYESVVLNFTNSPEYSIDLREVVSSAFYNYKPKDVDSKTKKRIIFDLKNKLHMELLKNKKDDIKVLQKNCETEEEMIRLLNQLTEIEKSIQILKNSKPEKN
jgi:DNA primase